MAKRAAAYACSACSAESLRWVGRCPRCDAFGTVVEVAPVRALPGLRTSGTGTAPARRARPLSEIQEGATPRLRTGLAEFDRVLGGGLVDGQVVLLAGEPGVGKSTLLAEVAHAVASSSPGSTVLYVSGEESVEQISVRARRIGATAPGILLADETDLGALIGHVEEHEPLLLVVDSVQAMASSAVDGRAGGMAQVQEVAQVLTRVAKARRMPLLMIGQSTRENAVAGPRALEHVVDTILTFEGDRSTSLRLLRATKNRYGPADETVCFEQHDTGLREVPDPADLFRSHRDEPVAGTCVTVTVDGRRAMAVEVQALVGAETSPHPRRGFTGLDPSRVAMLLAVTERAAGRSFGDRDVFLATVGGARLTDPSADFAICLAVASSSFSAPMPPDVAVIGEVALSGDIRPVASIGPRVAEAARLGYKRILVPKAVGRHVVQAPPGVRLSEMPHLKGGIARLQEIAEGR